MKGLTEDRFYKAVAGSLMLHLCLFLLLGRISFPHQPVNSLPNLMEVTPLRLESSSSPKPSPSAVIPSHAPVDTQRNISRSPHEKVPFSFLSRTDTSQRIEHQPKQALRTASRETHQKRSRGVLPPPGPGPSYQGGSSNPPKPSKTVGSSPSSLGERYSPTPGGPLNLGSPSAQGEDLGPIKGTTSVGIPPNLEGRGTGSGPGEGPGRAEKPQSGGGPPPRAEAGPSTGNRPGLGEGLPGEKPGSSTGSGDGEGPSSRVSSPAHQNRLADRKEPELIHFVPPTYPSEAGEEGVEGSVTLEYLINEKGEVKDVRVVKSSGDYRLDRSAVEAVKKWRYLPAVQDGIPRGVKRRRTIVFRLPQ